MPVSYDCIIDLSEEKRELNLSSEDVFYLAWSRKMLAMKTLLEKNEPSDSDEDSESEYSLSSSDSENPDQGGKQEGEGGDENEEGGDENEEGGDENEEGGDENEEDDDDDGDENVLDNSFQFFKPLDLVNSEETVDALPSIQFNTSGERHNRELFPGSWDCFCESIENLINDEPQRYPLHLHPAKQLELEIISSIDKSLQNGITRIFDNLKISLSNSKTAVQNFNKIFMKTKQ